MSPAITRDAHIANPDEEPSGQISGTSCQISGTCARNHAKLGHKFGKYRNLCPNDIASSAEICDNISRFLRKGRFSMFVGREKELAELNGLWNKVSCISLVTIRGRRRIGKSTLVEEFARRSGAKFLKVEGMALKFSSSNGSQLNGFYSQLQLQTGETYEVRDWLKAFKDLDAAVDDSRRMVVLIDEISWMGHFDPMFASYLKVAWDNFFHRHAKLILFLCGSVSSWIRENILEDAGFLGRPSLDIVLKELPAVACRQFWGAAANRLSSREFLDMLSVTGGVPRYLEEIRPALTVDENLRSSCFSPTGYLFKDFDLIFNELFDDKAEDRKNVLACLTERAMTVSEIGKALKRQRSGHLSDTLRDLQEAGFVAVERGNNPETGELRQEIRYRICDNYARFYLHTILPRREMIKDGTYRFESLEQLPGWESILGLQFENLILAAMPEVIRRLRLDRSRILSMAPFRRFPSDEKRGCQIDCLLQTKRSLYVIEIKRQANIGLDIIREVETKIERLPRNPALSVRQVLIYDGKLSPSILDENYFSAVFSAAEILGEN